MASVITHVLGGEARGEGGRSVLERNAHQHALELGNLVLQASSCLACAQTAAKKRHGPQHGRLVAVAEMPNAEESASCASWSFAQRKGVEAALPP